MFPPPVPISTELLPISTWDRSIVAIQDASKCSRHTHRVSTLAIDSSISEWFVVDHDPGTKIVAVVRKEKPQYAPQHKLLVAYPFKDEKAQNGLHAILAVF